MAGMSSPVFSRSFQLTFIVAFLFLVSACTNSGNSSSSEREQNKSALQGETVILSVDDVANDSVVTNGSSGIELTFEWSIISRPANSNAELSDPNGSEPTFVADQPGEYVVGLIIRNGSEELLNTTITVVVEPSGSSDSTDPTDPTDPADPTNPTDPTDPTNPTDPTSPTDPSDPTDPAPTDPVKPDTHLSTTDNCLACHASDTWVVVNFDHAEAVGACVECHNGVIATGKSPNHINSTDNCAACHIVTNQLSGWLKPPSIMDHSEALGTCSSCHDGFIFPPYPSTHIPTNEDCGVCHTTDAWIPASGPDHSSFVGNCVSCHDGERATGKVSNHINSTDLCDACHDKLAQDWRTLLPTGVDHTQVIGACSDCHNGELARGMGDTHIQTTLECDNCHVSTSWTQVPAVDHSGFINNCTTCHDGQSASGKSPNHINSTDACEACHAVFPAPWIPVANTAVNHDHVIGSCYSCHNSSPLGPVKPYDHIPSTDNCGACHLPGPSPWAPVENDAVDHTQVIGSCSSCHDNVIATGKNAVHVPTTDECDICHGVSQWIPAAVDHTGFTNNCISCHDGIIASGKSGAHINATDVCDACHESFPAQWTPVASNAVDHVQVIGTCSSCHDGVIAPGKSGTHVPTTTECNVCHGVSQWIHAAIDHTGFVNNCVTCHDGIVASGKSDNHISSTDVCDTCHESFPAQWTPVANTSVDHTQVIGTCSTCHALPSGHMETAGECDACHGVVSWVPGLPPHDLWVIDNNNDQISKLNLADGTVEFQFVAPGGNGNSDSSHGLAWDGEYFWTFHVTGNRLYKVDANGDAVNFFDIPVYLFGLEYVDGTLWAVGSGSVLAINPVDGSYTSIPSPVAAPQAITFDGVSSLWVVGNTADDEIYTIDINTLATEYKFNSPDLCPSGLEYYRDQLYIIGCRGLWIIDPITGDTVRNLPTSGIGYGTDLTFVPANISADNNTPPSTPPVAVVDADSNVLVGNPVLLYGGYSYDPDGDPLSYLWEFISQPVGSTAAINSNTASSTSFVPDLAGEYAISLTVNDGALDSEAYMVTITAVAAGSCQTNASCISGSYCEKPAGACGSAGTCAPKPFTCLQIYAPVCGCDGQTYSNSCIAAENGVNVAYDGAC